jgi:hypothetical protein
MAKHLHESLTHHTTSLNQHTDPIASMQQKQMEKEFSSELAVLKTVKLDPRPEAVEQLFQLIAQQSVAEQH